MSNTSYLKLLKTLKDLSDASKCESAEDMQQALDKINATINDNIQYYDIYADAAEAMLTCGDDNSVVFFKYDDGDIDWVLCNKEAKRHIVGSIAHFSNVLSGEKQELAALIRAVIEYIK